ncbi:60S ribosomal protein L7-3 [Bienertia sinuspersici]
MLEKVESYVTYGYSNLKSVRDLIFKTSLEKLEKERVPLIDNNDIEQALEKHGILYLEDMVHECHTVGPHFKDATRFLWPFSLAKPEGEFLGKKNTFKNVGDSGNRKEHINDLIAKIT